jgi:hypothetical protein
MTKSPVEPVYTHMKIQPWLFDLINPLLTVIYIQSTIKRLVNFSNLQLLTLLEILTKIQQVQFAFAYAIFHFAFLAATKGLSGYIFPPR